MRPSESPQLRRTSVRWRAGLIVAAAVLSVIACAGGDSSGIGSGGSGSVTDSTADGSGTPAPAPAPAPSTAPVPGIGLGAIAGFGSIVVNGVAWDETAATVTGDDGGPADRSWLVLGRQVSVTGSIDPQTGRGSATVVSLRRAVSGLIDRFDANGRPVVLGLPVATDVGTTWAAPLSAVAGLRVGDRVEIYGVVAADNSVVRASRVEQAVLRFSLREGIVSGTRSDRCGFSLGTLVVDCSHAGVAPRGTIPNGSRVRVSAARDAVSGTLTVDRVDLIEAPSAAGGTRVAAEGRIASLSLAGATAVVEGWTFDLSKATITGAPPGGLVAGLEVSVSGVTSADGTISATRLKVETDDATLGREFEATGPISSWVNRNAFVVRGVRIDARGAKIDGAAASLGNGVIVELKGRLVDGVVKAEELKVKN